MILFFKDNEIIILRWNKTCISSKTSTNCSRKKTKTKNTKTKKKKNPFFQQIQQSQFCHKLNCFCDKNDLNRKCFI